MRDIGPPQLLVPTATEYAADALPPGAQESWILESEESIRAEARAFGEERRRKRRSRRRHALSWIAIVVGAVGLAVLIRTYAVQTFFVPSRSMTPMLLVGDRILVDKLPVLSRDIQRGDIIVFRRVARDTEPSGPSDLVKRVIGLPGETVSSRGDVVLINGKRLAEPWLPNLKKVPGCFEKNLNIRRTVVPARSYFVLGDCRGDSSDSRVWGVVPASHIIGKVFLVAWRNGHPWFHWF
ncbi:MAG: signal peptidase I [Acidimicrobiales bacterium]